MSGSKNMAGGLASEEARPWWIEHSPSATVIVISAVTAVLYFFGNRQLTSLAEEFGLAGPPRALGLQEVMMAGVDVLRNGALLTIIGVVFVWWLFTKGVDYGLETVRKSSDELSADLPKLRARTDALAADIKTATRADVDAVEKTVRDYERRSRDIDRQLARVKFGSFLAFLVAGVFCGIGLSLVVVAGDRAGQKLAAAIRKDVNGPCARCFRYSTDANEIVAAPVFQADGFIVAYSKTGIRFISTESLRVRRFDASSKKAGHLKETHKPTGALRPPPAPASPPAGSPSG